MRDVCFSIIIPHYKTPELLMRCIGSIPIREDIQVIVVDDCSPDAETYKGRYPELSRQFLEFYSTPRGGSAGRARNIGIDYAKGKWLLFLDADDFLVDDIETIFALVQNREEDVVYFRSKCVRNDDLTKTAKRNDYSHCFDAFFTNANEDFLRFRFYPMWGKFVKRSIVEAHNIRFDETRYSNDFFFSAAIGVYAKKIYIYDIIACIITEREGSLKCKKKMSLEEWKIRRGVTMKTQKFLDCNKIDFHYDNLGGNLYLLRNYPTFFFRHYPSIPKSDRVELIKYLTHKIFSWRKQRKNDLNITLDQNKAGFKDCPLSNE